MLGMGCSGPFDTELIQRRIGKTMSMNSNLPDGLRSITPYFTVHDADSLIDFLVAAFDATVIKDNRYSNNTVQHARLRIGDSILMMNESTDAYPANVSQIHLYVEDIDTAFAKAIEAGASVLMEPNTRPHGDRMAGVNDPHGNVWWIASPA